MKTILSHSLLAGAITVFFACNNADKHDTTTADNDRVGTEKSAEEHNDAKFNSDNEKDAQFVVDAVKHNLDEIAR
jgi:hypothetical protein